MIDKEVALYAVQARLEAARRLGNSRLEEHALVLLEDVKLGLYDPEEAIHELERVYA